MVAKTPLNSSLGTSVAHISCFLAWKPTEMICNIVGCTVPLQLLSIMSGSICIPINAQY